MKIDSGERLVKDIQGPYQVPLPTKNEVELQNADKN